MHRVTHFVRATREKEVLLGSKEDNNITYGGSLSDYDIVIQMTIRRCRKNLSTEANLNKKAGRRTVFGKELGWFFYRISSNKTRKRRKDGYFQGLTRKRSHCFSFFLVLSSIFVANAFFVCRIFYSMYSLSTRIPDASLRRPSSPHAVVMANNTVLTKIAMSPSLSIPWGILPSQDSEISTERTQRLPSSDTQSMADRMQRNASLDMSLPADDVDVDDFYAPDGNPVVETGTKRCRRNQWSRLLFSNCNTVHEYNALQLFREGITKVIG